ncbi:MAG: hypothetical protein FD147_1504 [Chloroflexi bacterium]|nr:MAG: hypothetical protein FD147_1504 [Chloroflexota bacterium]MBA4376215.1 hypothetical protein [Anaerolinea sp.]
MNIEITPFFLVLAAVIGLLIGLLVASLFSSRESKSADEKAPPADLANEGFAEVTRLWYSPSGKKIVTELDGEFYREFLVLSPDQKKRVLRILSLWSNWTSKTSESSVEKIETAGTFGGQELKPIQFEEFPATNAFHGQAISEVINPNPDFEKPGQSEPSLPEPGKPKTIAGQISLIIEKMLETSPLREKGIKLIENEHHGVDVWIGMEKFDGIDAIPYPDAQQLIRAAAAQWEREAELERKLSGNG